MIEFNVDWLGISIMLLVIVCVIVIGFMMVALTVLEDRKHRYTLSIILVWFCIGLGVLAGRFSTTSAQDYLNNQDNYVVDTICVNGHIVSYDVHSK